MKINRKYPASRDYLLLSNLFIFSLVIFLNSCSRDSSKNSGKTSKAKVIANWDVIPHQYIHAKTSIGVVAFHEAGVDVEFTINGITDWITNPSYNPQTKVWEYWIETDPFLYPDGPLAITATAYTNNRDMNSARKLPDLCFYSNAHGTLSNNNIKYADSVNGDDNNDGDTPATAYRTLERAYVSVENGGTVNLLAGTYSWQTGVSDGRGYTEWTTITHDTSVARDHVIIEPRATAEKLFYQDFVHWIDVTLRRVDGVLLYTPWTYHTWFDSCRLISPLDSGGLTAGAMLNSQGSEYYMNNCEIVNFENP